jgi:hypothetical protein
MPDHRKHTPITSEAQRRLFGAVASGSADLPGLSKAEAERHLRESKGKNLPEKVSGASKDYPKKSKKIVHHSPAMLQVDHSQQRKDEVC